MNGASFPDQSQSRFDDTIVISSYFPHSYETCSNGMKRSISSPLGWVANPPLITLQPSPSLFNCSLLPIFIPDRHSWSCESQSLNLNTKHQATMFSPSMSLLLFSATHPLRNDFFRVKLVQIHVIFPLRTDQLSIIKLPEIQWTNDFTPRTPELDIKLFYMKSNIQRYKQLP